MQKVSKLSLWGKVIADLSSIFLVIVIIQRIFLEEGFFSSSNLIMLGASLGCWLLSARVLGLYSDFRTRPFSDEWVVFLKSLVIYTLVFSFFISHFLNKLFLAKP